MVCVDTLAWAYLLTFARGCIARPFSVFHAGPARRSPEYVARFAMVLDARVDVEVVADHVRARRYFRFFANYH